MTPPVKPGRAWLAAAAALIVLGAAQAQTTAFPARGATDDASCAVGLGNDLYVGGGFTSVGGTPARHVARWDGTSWSALGAGVDAPRRAQVFALAAHGDHVYVGGVFRTAGGLPARNVARWNTLTQTWSALGAGLDDWVTALAVHDDGTGPRLYAGGLFQSSGGVPMRHLARWNELAGAWQPVALGPDLGADGPVLALLSTSLSGTPTLFAGGEFTRVGGIAAHNVARLAGGAWTPLAGMTNEGAGGRVQALAVYDDGGGDALYAGGDFLDAGGNAATRIARWNGLDWAPLASGVGANAYEEVRSLAVFDFGSGPVLVAGGRFERAGSVQIGDVAPAGLVNDESDSSLGAPPSFVAAWDGSAWSGVGLAMDGLVDAIVVHQEPTAVQPTVFAVGHFSRAGGLVASRVARWSNGTNAWGPLGGGQGASHAVRALATFDDGLGLDLYAGGDFVTAGGVKTNGVARWEQGSGTWAALDGGVEGTVRALETADVGGVGNALYAAGDFTGAGGTPARFVARWDAAGSSWLALGANAATGLDGPVFALVAHDDGLGGGTQLYAGGAFTRAGAVSADHVARWNGSAWAPLPGGGPDEEVLALAEYQGDLIAGGVFLSAGGRACSRIARWNGTSWSPLGTGIEGEVHALAVVGGMLYAGGDFARVGALSSPNLARWDGAAWQPVGGGLDGPVLALTADQPSGHLLVGGRFATAGATPAANAARWDGASWTELASGTDGAVHALRRLGGKLYLGGVFANGGGAASSHLVAVAHP